VDRFVLCPACKTKNRIPEEKAGEAAKCGNCGDMLPKEDPAAAPSLILRCTSCGGRNRVPMEKLKPGVSCGKCHAPLQTEDILTPWAIPVSDANFEDKVLKSPLPVLLEFVSSTCGACNISRPVVNQLAVEMKGRFRVGRTDVLVNPATAGRYKVMSTPTSLMFDRGRLVDTIIGAAPREAFLEKMAPYLNK
jgi:thioredoxin 2